MDLITEFEEAYKTYKTGMAKKSKIQMEDGRVKFRKALSRMVSKGIKRKFITEEASIAIGCSKESFNARLSGCIMTNKTFRVFKSILTDELKIKCDYTEIKESLQYVYVVKNLENKKVKVGKSNTPEKRIRQIMTGSGFECQDHIIFGPFKDSRIIEGKAHEILSEYRTIGEWFIVDYNQAVDAVRLSIKFEEYKTKWRRDDSY